MRRPLSEVRPLELDSEQLPKDFLSLVKRVKTVLIADYPEALEGRFQDLDKGTIRDVVSHMLDTGQASLPTGYGVADVIDRIVLSIVGVPELEPFFQNPDVTDIMVKGNKIYIETPEKGKFYAGAVDPARVEEWVRQIAAGEDREFNYQNPKVNLFWDDRRISAIKPPLSSVLAVSIRIHRLREIPLEFFVDGEALAFLVEAVRTRKNIIIMGPAGAGKSTLLQALARHIPGHEFPYVIEDVREIKLHHEAAVSLQAQKAFDENNNAVTLHELVQVVLRQNPDRIILQELLGREALELLDAAGTGQAGCMTTIHANTPSQAINRLALLMTRAQPQGSAAYRNMIFEVIDLIIHVDKIRTGTGLERCIQSITALSGNEIKSLFSSSPGGGELVQVGDWEDAS